MTEVTLEIDIDDAVETALANIDMSDYIDHDDIRYDIQEDILSQVNDYIDDDHIRWCGEGTFAGADEFHALRAEVQELQEQMEKLLEVIRLPADPPSIRETITHAPLEDVRDIYMVRREERYNAIRYMSKPELVAWCEENDYDVDDMTVKQIHEMIL
jgi:hypothetical protein